MLERAKPEYISKTYKIDSWQNEEEFLEKLAFQTGKLLKVKEAAFSSTGEVAGLARSR